MSTALIRRDTTALTFEITEATQDLKEQALGALALVARVHG